ncbi:MAG TPA: cation-translocating P-type ATPase [Acetobacteraceae bacterium]|nr:cation-translocating P-type ATPase [Acetobacteraceae bacterium]
MSKQHLGLAVRLTTAMIAAGLLLIAVAWQELVPQQQYLSELVAGGAALLVGVPIVWAAWQSILRPSLHGMTDLLVATALVAAWATGDLITAAILPIVMVVGHVLEERSLLGSQEAIRALGRLVETTCRRLRCDGTVEEVPTESLAVGEHVEVRPGDRVPVDGTVLSGTSSVDTASLTGESVPLDVAENDAVMAGSINLDGRLVVQVARIGHETTLGKIVALMARAEQAKPPVTRLLERYAGQYLTLILMIAAGTWFATKDSQSMLAVLVASCPCALVLAAPATAVAAIAVAARHGILIKGSGFLEQLAEVTSVVFDKTGTITEGELSLVAALPAAGWTQGDLLYVAGLLGAGSSHPVSRALARHAASGSDTAPAAAAEIRELRGFGVTARLPDGRPAALGRPELFADIGIATGAVPDHDGPVAGLGCDGMFLGWLLFADEVRPEAGLALADIRGLGLTRQMLLTGDRARVASRVGDSLGIARICAEALPEEKMRQVLQEIRDGYRPLVVGDGINDSLALKAGAVGIALGGKGTDVALASADLVLMSNDLRRLGTAIRLSRRCRQTILVNVAMGLGWTVLLVCAAASGVLGPQGAVIAAVFHNVGTLAGMANAGRLLSFDETGRAPRTAVGAAAETELTGPAGQEAGAPLVVARAAE